MYREEKVKHQKVVLNPLKPKLMSITFNIQFLPQREHNTFNYEDQLGNDIYGNSPVYSENHTKVFITPCWQNAEIMDVEVGGIHSY